MAEPQREPVTESQLAITLDARGKIIRSTCDAPPGEMPLDGRWQHS